MRRTLRKISVVFAHMTVQPACCRRPTSRAMTSAPSSVCVPQSTAPPRRAAGCSELFPDGMGEKLTDFSDSRRLLFPLLLLLLGVLAAVPVGADGVDGQAFLAHGTLLSTSPLGGFMALIASSGVRLGAVPPYCTGI